MLCKGIQANARQRDARMDRQLTAFVGSWSMFRKLSFQVGEGVQAASMGHDFLTPVEPVLGSLPDAVRFNSKT